MAAVAFALAAACCTTSRAPFRARPALPLDERLASRYAVPGGVVQRDWIRDGDEVSFTLIAGGESARCHAWIPDGEIRPFVLLVPILAGGDALMRAIAKNMLERGFAACYCERAGPALRPPQRGEDLEALFQRTVIQQRMVLEWARSSDCVRGEDSFLLGVSLGGMVSSVVAALEPGLSGTAICLSGGDLPDLVVHSHERRVIAWRDFRRATDGLGDSCVREELAARLESDPARLAPFVETRTVLLVEAAFDDVVPAWNRAVLWEALGRPRRFTVPAGHYTAALLLNPILDAVAEFFSARLLVGREAARGAASP
ncbi:MAG: hypothetical protein Fur0037_08300 [Planctomycetota bacterium]